MLDSVKNAFCVLLLFVVAALSTGCASFLGSPMHNVRVLSEPSNASYRIADENGDEVASGTTPESVLLRTSTGLFQKSRYYITIDLPGYRSQTNKLNAKISGWYWLNLISHIPGIMGFAIIDPFTGAMFALPDESSVMLEATP